MIDNELYDMIIEHDNTLVLNTVHAVEQSLYEYGQFDPLAQRITIYREDLKKALYQVIKELKE